MNRSRISIVLACFDNTHTHELESSLCSVLDQNDNAIELIVVDGSPHDHTTATLRHYRDDIDLWIRERCQTLAQTINLGLARATGDIVAVLNAGDLYLHGCLETVRKQMASGATWVIGSCQHINEYDERLGLCQPSQPTSLLAFLKHDSGLLPGASSFWRRDILDGQPVVMDQALHHAHEYDLACRLLASGCRPTLTHHVLTARRESDLTHSAQATLAHGRETLQVAMRYACHLSPTQVYSLLRNCDYRSRIYAMAEAEMLGHTRQQKLMRTLLRRPWHLMDEAIRQVMLQGQHGSAPMLDTPPQLKPAA